MRRGLIIGAIGASVAGGASAADWQITPSLSLNEVITDNVFGGPSSDKKADAITEIVPGIDIYGQSARGTIGFNYHPSIGLYVANSSQDRVDQSLIANGNVIPFQDFLNVEFNAFAAETSGSGSFTSPAAGGLIPNNDRVLSFGGSITPHIQERFGDVATLDASYRVTSSNNSPDSADPNRTVLASNLMEQEAKLIVGSGESFGRLSSSLSFDHDETSGSGFNNQSQNDTDLLNLEYHISHDFSVVGSVGYEHLHWDRSAGSLGYNTEGLTWDTGFRWTPSDTSFLYVTYGQREGSYDAQVQFHYDLSPRTLLSASYAVTVQNQLQANVQNLAFLVRDQFGNPVDTRTGLPFVVIIPTFGQQNTLTRDKLATVAVTRELDARSSVTLSVFEERRGAVTGASSNDQGWGGTITYSRELWPDLHGNVDFGYNDHRFGAFFFSGGGSRERFANFDASLAYNINPTLSGTVTYSYFRRLSDIAFGNEVVNSLLIGLRKEF